MSHFCRICPTFFAFCFGVSGHKRLTTNSLHDIFERRAADGRDIGSAAGGWRRVWGQTPGFGGGWAGWPGLIGRSRVAGPVGGAGFPEGERRGGTGAARRAPSRNESAGRLSTLGGRRPADCCRRRIDLAVNGNHLLTRVARGRQRTFLELSSRPPDGDGSGGSNRPAFWADRRIRSRNRSLALNSMIFLPRCSGTRTTKPEGIDPASVVRQAD